jgi:8-oxo-dGTP diphosphatase
MKKHIEVVAAIIERNGKIFCAQRPSGGEVGFKWEFPGGKIESNETHVQALKREIKEEFTCEIEVGNLIDSIFYEYKTFSLTLHAYQCRVVSGQIIPTEHVDIMWIEKNKLHELDFAFADTLLFSKIINHLKE